MNLDQPTTERTEPRRGTALLFAVAALAFVLPFGTASCNGETVSFTGLQLATATVPPDPAETEPDDGLADDVEEASPVALTALVLAGFGIASALLRRRGGGFALVATLALGVLLLEAVFSFAEVRIQLGFWLALVATGGAGVVRLLDRWRTRATGPRRAFWRRMVPSRATGLLAITAVGVVALLVSVLSTAT